MRCLRAILGVTLKDKLSNETIRQRLKSGPPITEKIKKRRLRWFGHVTRRPPENYVSRVYRHDFANSRPRGRPAKRWIDQVRQDTGIPIATAELRAADRKGWRRASYTVGARGDQRLCQ